MTDRFNFTYQRLEALEAKSARLYYQDTREPRLGLYITPAGVKSFFARLNINGKTVRRRVGRFPDMSVALAREKATQATAMVAAGIDPLELKRRSQTLSITLNELLEEYIRSHDLKPLTIKDYRIAIAQNFSDWLNKPLDFITEQRVMERYLKRGEEASKARTDNGARVLRALFNFARTRYKSEKGESCFPVNPTHIISDAKIRYQQKRQKRKIELTDLPNWWRAVHNIRNPIARDWLLFMLFTGCRKTESASLRWQQVDFKNQKFELLDSKNNQKVALPLPSYVAELLMQRREEDGWVFPSTQERTSYLENPYRWIRWVRHESGVPFCAHDIRRSYISIASNLGIPPYIIKQLVNHSVNKSTSTQDITEGHIGISMEELREASQKIEAMVLRIVLKYQLKLSALQQ